MTPLTSPCRGKSAGRSPPICSISELLAFQPCSSCIRSCAASGLCPRITLVGSDAHPVQTLASSPVATMDFHELNNIPNSPSVVLGQAECAVHYTMSRRSPGPGPVDRKHSGNTLCPLKYDLARQEIPRFRVEFIVDLIGISAKMISEPWRIPAIVSNRSI